MILVSAFLVIFVTPISSAKYGAEDSLSLFSGLTLKHFLAQSSGQLRIGNQVLKFPQDLEKIFGNVSHGIGRSIGEEEEEVVHHLPHPPPLRRHHMEEKAERDLSLISIGNFFRLGCVVMHLQEIQESVKFELEKRGGHGPHPPAHHGSYF